MSRGKPPLRKFVVRVAEQGDNVVNYVDHEVIAHLVFDNSSRGEGLVFRRYYGVTTEKVAEFQPGVWTHYRQTEEVEDGKRQS